MERPGHRSIRSAAIAALAFACLAALTLTPHAWAIPGLLPANQTIPTRTPDRGSGEHDDTPIPIPTDTETLDTPTPEPASPTSTLADVPTSTETSQVPEAVTDAPAATDTPPSTATPMPHEATETAIAARRCVPVGPNTPVPTYFVVTSVPTPANAATAMAYVAEVQRVGTATPVPCTWVTPIVVTPTPTPANEATADRLTVVACLSSLAGTPTPTPVNMFTATPSPTYFVITSVPTPENGATAVAWLEEATTRAQREGTPTLLPANWVTPIVVTSTPTPANEATADRLTVVAYLASLTGTPTPTRVNMSTATPSPTYFVITSVPTPGNVATAVARLEESAARAKQEGTDTPLPRNWVTPIVVTSTPIPANQATADHLTMTAYAVSTAGGPTPTPANMLTATPTPLTVADAVVDPTLTPAPTWTPTTGAPSIPSEWFGRIAFVSDRQGGEPAYYIMDANGSNVQQLSGPALYDAALARDTLDPTGGYQVFVSSPRGPGYDPTVGKNTEISLRRLSDGSELYVTGGTKGADYEPAYCWADSRYIAYTSEQSGGADIYVVDLFSGGGTGSELRTVRLTQNDWPWDKHPSWSPECQQVVFYSNRDGRKQIYIMDFLGMDYPGGNPRNVSNNPYNDWDPVWFK